LKEEIALKADYWIASGDAAYQRAVDKWADEKYGDWRLKIEIFKMERLYDTYLRRIDAKTKIPSRFEN
jgi:hypothetical protein